MSPASGAAAAVARPRRWLPVLLGEERFGVLLEAVESIASAARMEVDEEAPEAVCGILSEGGRRVPVLDLRQRLATAPAVPRRAPLAETDGESSGEDPRPRPGRLQDPGRVVLVQSRGHRLGLWVDRVESPLWLQPRQLRRLPPLVLSAGCEHLAGLGVESEGWLILLDVDQLLTQRLGSASEPASTPEDAVTEDSGSQDSKS
ncbi:MAG: chemotaxis protein CheW [Acidobacteriota bacterium]|nr:chemotaxis protein CheW [Acidobacteriota bacterium]